MSDYVEVTERWIRRFVVGWNMCPFAGPVVKKQLHRVRYTEATTEDELFREFLVDLETLYTSTPEALETSMLVHPHVLQDFLDYNDFIGVAEAGIARVGLEGIIQVASFHPGYLFAEVDPGDISHYTNRSPYPMLHLIREESVSKAVAGYPDIEEVAPRNIARLKAEGFEKLRALLDGLGEGD